MFPVAVIRTVHNGVTIPLSDIVLSGEETQKVYFSFPEGTFFVEIKAYKKDGLSLLTINNKFSCKIHRDIPQDNFKYFIRRNCK